MFERKLKALGYLEWDKVNGNSEQLFDTCHNLYKFIKNQEIYTNINTVASLKSLCAM